MAYPLIDKATKTGDNKLQVFPDNFVGGLYWYVPTSVEPLVENGKPMSELYVGSNELMFMFRGQASVSEELLNEVAQSLGVPRSNLKPIFYDENKMTACSTSMFEPNEVKWMVPQQLGNFMEIVPFGARTRNKELIPVLAEYFNGTGLACLYEYKFSGAYTAFKVHVELDLNRIYTRIQNEAHAEGLWWEVDLKSFMERLKREGLLTITQYQDSTTTSPTVIDEKIKASFDDVLTKVITMIFTPATKLHDEDMVGRGKPWSLRSDYRRQEENNHFVFDLESQAVQKRTSQIAIRLGLK
jgi:hypothetical protein